jgi:16S rRNA U516 pseudouridylate synthase RsuA-like enzyme
MVESRMSRERAERLLAAGLVTVDGQPVKDPAAPVTRAARVVIRGR